MDIGIIRELFPHCITASKILGMDEEFCGKLESALTKLPPYQINSLGTFRMDRRLARWRSGAQLLAQLPVLSRQLHHAARHARVGGPPLRNGWISRRPGGGLPVGLVHFRMVAAGARR